MTYGLGLDFLLAHPYRLVSWIRIPYPVDATFLDGIEVYNANPSDETTARALSDLKDKRLRSWGAAPNTPARGSLLDPFFGRGIRLLLLGCFHM